MCTKQLHEAIEYSEKMLIDAEAGNWENVFDIEAQRNRLLKKLFSGSSKQNDIHDMDDKIREIIAINNKLEAITLKARDDAQKGIASISKGRQAVDLYAQNTL